MNNLEKKCLHKFVYPTGKQETLGNKKVPLGKCYGCKTSIQIGQGYEQIPATIFIEGKDVQMYYLPQERRI